MMRADFTPLAKLTIERPGTDVPSHKATEFIARHFTVGVPMRADEVVKAMGSSAYLDALRRGLLRVEIVDGDLDLVHVVQDTPSDAPTSTRPSPTDGDTVKTLPELLNRADALHTEFLEIIAVPDDRITDEQHARARELYSEIMMIRHLDDAIRHVEDVIAFGVLRIEIVDGDRVHVVQPGDLSGLTP